MRYFAAHEAIYRKRLSAGKTGWDDGAYENHALVDAVRVWTSRSKALRSGARVLELGCGTGALSCQLAAAGCKVTGLDVSPSAITFARSTAEIRGLEIEFVAASAGDWLTYPKKYDVVIDSHMLHCLTTQRDRAAVLVGVHAALAEDGEFWTESMMMPKDFEPSSSQRIDEAGVLWVQVSASLSSPDVVEDHGECWLPSRYLAPSAAALIEEFRTVGLEARQHEVVPSTSGGPSDFRARLSKRRNEA